MQVIINQEHAKGNYFNSEDCPLFRAIKEQYPEIPIVSVRGFGQIICTDRTRYEYSPAITYISSDEEDKEAWGHTKYCQLKSGEIESFTVTIKEVK